MEKLIGWFTGGEYFDYHLLFHCMDGDLFTMTIVLLLCLGVFSGYLIIARRWSIAAATSPPTDGQRALNELKWIFIFCSICGYMWIILEAVWPAWRLYIFFLFALNVFTWRYVFRIQGLEEVYSWLREKDDLIKQLEHQREEIERLRKATLR